MIRLLIRLFPPSFRERFGEELVQLCTDLRQDAAARGRRALCQTTLHCLLDFLGAALRERYLEMTKETRNAILAALAAGLLFGWFDTRTSSDDTGVLAILLLSLSFLVAALFPKRPLLTGVLVGLGVPLCHLVGILTHRLAPVPLAEFLETLIAVIPAIIGALVGSGARRQGERLRRRA